MRFLSSFIFLATCTALALPASAAPLVSVKRDMEAMTETFDHIFAGIDNMVSALNSFSGPADLAKVNSARSEYRNAILSGSKRLSSSPSMTIAQLVSIGGPLFVMWDKIDDLVTAFHNKKPELEKIGAARAILQDMKEDKAAVDNLVTSVNANLPMAALLSFIANPIGKAVTGKLNDGIKEFGG